MFENYGPLKCSKTGHTLFTRANWKQAANVLEAIRLGHVSDPPGLSLYLHIATDKNNLPIYKCFRGTNSVEGGIHQNVIYNFTSFNAGPQLTDAILADYILRHNIKVISCLTLQKIYYDYYSPFWSTCIY